CTWCPYSRSDFRQAGGEGNQSRSGATKLIPGNSTPKNPGGSGVLKSSVECQGTRCLAGDTPMADRQWKYLAHNPKSSYKQLFVKGTRIRAEILYGMTVDGPGEDRLTPAQVAEEYNLPVEAVLEAIAYCDADPAEVREDHAREEALMEATGMKDPDYKYG